MLEKTLESALDCKDTNQSILKEINTEYSVERVMLKLKLQCFGHLMWRTHWKRHLMLGKIEGRRKRGQQRMRWLDDIMDSMDMNLSKQQTPGDSEAQGSLVCYSLWGHKESAIHIRWPKYWSFSFSNSLSNEYSGLISFRIDWFVSLQSKALSRVFSSTTVEKHQFFSNQPSLWSSSHIYT